MSDEHGPGGTQASKKFKFKFKSRKENIIKARNILTKEQSILLSSFSSSDLLRMREMLLNTWLSCRNWWSV
jgi:hypothetical protein